MKIIIVAAVIFLTGLSAGLCPPVLADPYDYGETVPIHFVVPDSADGEPITPDSIKVAVYFESGTAPVVSETDMTNWDGKTGEFYYNFTVPDSSGVYVPRIRWKAQDREYVLWLDNIYAAEIFDSSADTVFARADVVRLSGDSAAADNLEAVLDGTAGVGSEILANRRGRRQWLRQVDAAPCARRPRPA